MELKDQKKKVKKPVKSVNVGLKVRQAGKEIEELFSSAQKGAGSDLKKPQTAASAKKEANSVIESLNSRKNSKRKSAIDEKSSSYGVIQSEYNAIKIVNPEAPLERIDPESGLPVYKAHLLKVGEGGGTPLCPFDCNCCF